MKTSFAALVATALVLSVPLGSAEPVRAAEGATESTTTAPPSISVMVAQKKQITEELVATGSFAAGASVRVPALVDGLAVVEILAEEGDSVKEGQVLARLMADDVALLLKQNDASLARNAASILSAKNQIEQAKINKEQARLNWDRTNKLRKRGVSTVEQLDQRSTDHELAQNQIKAAELALASAEADHKVIEAQRDELLLRKSRTEIKAPVDGFISARLVEYGMVSSTQGNPMFRIVAHNLIKLVAEVPEADLPKAKLGLPVKVFVNGYKDAFAGEVALISPEVDAQTRMGQVHVRMAEGTRLPLGAFGRAVIELAAEEGVTLPLTAVTFVNDTATVQVVKEGRVEVREVKTGLVSATEVEILSGIAVGESYVARAGSFVRDGDVVTPVVISAAN